VATLYSVSSASLSSSIEILLAVVVIANLLRLPCLTDRRRPGPSQAPAVGLLPAFLALPGARPRLGVQVVHPVPLQALHDVLSERVVRHDHDGVLSVRRAAELLCGVVVVRVQETPEGLPGVDHILRHVRGLLDPLY